MAINFSNYIHQNADYFRENTFHHLQTCSQVYENNETFSTIITAAIATESLMKDILIVLADNLSVVEGDLSELVNALRSFLKPKDKSNFKYYNPEKDTLLYNNLIEYVQQLRPIRNRLSHDRGMKNTSLDVEANYIMSILQRIIDTYLKTALAEEIHLRNTSKTEDISKEATEQISHPDFKVFLSTITPHTSEQKAFLNAFRKKLRDLGIEPVSGDPQDINDHKNPMESARDRMKPCDAVIVLGLERTHAYLVCDKEGGEGMNEATHRRYTSSWLHMEAGYAIALNKDLYVVHQENLFPDGIFDNVENSFPRRTLSLPLSADDPQLDALFIELKKKMKEKKEQLDKKQGSDSWGLE